MTMKAGRMSKFSCIRYFIQAQLLAVIAIFGGSPAFAQTCPTEDPSIDNAKSHKLFLYFSTTTDLNFPPPPPPLSNPVPWHPDARPAQPFDVADLSPGIGTTAQLIDAIKYVV